MAASSNSLSLSQLLLFRYALLNFLFNFSLSLFAMSAKALSIFALRLVLLQLSKFYWHFELLTVKQVCGLNYEIGGKQCYVDL